MCRLMAYAGPSRSLDAYLAAPEQSLRALVGADNADGWGFARWSGGRPAVQKAPRRADEDAQYLEAAQWTRSHAVLAHIRGASPGLGVSEENTHPFAHGPFAFAHNGTLHGLDDAAHARLVSELPEALRGQVRGTTDSEIAFYLVLADVLREHKTLDVPIELAARNLARVTQRLLKEFPANDKGEPSEANLVLGTWRGFAITRAGKSLALLRGEGWALVASEPIGPAADAARWEEVPEQALVLLTDAGQVNVRALSEYA